jgi:hypothetical protein
MATIKDPSRRERGLGHSRCEWCYRLCCTRPRTRPVRIVLLLFLVAVYLKQELEAAVGQIDRAQSNKVLGPSSYGSHGKPSSSLTSPPAIRLKDERGIEMVTKHRPIQSTSSTNQQERPHHLSDPVNVLYFGEFGIGHRLSKMSAAYHLVWMVRHEHNRTSRSGAGGAAIDQLVLEATWGHCELGNRTRVEIFSSLFGPGPLLRWHSSRSVGASDHQFSLSPRSGAPATILIRNDVKGYYAGQMYKNARTAVTPELLQAWDYKMHTTDLDLFRQLLQRFRFRDVAVRYQQERDWGGHFVVGVHFRLGNGEQEHFASSNRAVADAKRLVHQTVRLILQYREAVLSRAHASAIGSYHDKPWAIYVASDTPDTIPTVQAVLDMLLAANGGDSIPLWASPSISHLPERGVSYTITESDACFDGWKFAMVDQYLLSHVQMLVAPTRSTFTQILPRAMVMSQPLPPITQDDLHGSRQYKVDSPSYASTRRGTFCEVEFDQALPRCSARMKCYTDSMDWLHLRNGTSRTLRVSIDDNATLECHGRDSKHKSVPSLFVPHKVLVHLPETTEELRLAIDQWRKQMWAAPSTAVGASSAIRYGERIAQKYRRYAFHSDWNFG